MALHNAEWFSTKIKEYRACSDNEQADVLLAEILHARKWDDELLSGAYADKEKAEEIRNAATEALDKVIREKMDFYPLPLHPEDQKKDYFGEPIPVYPDDDLVTLLDKHAEASVRGEISMYDPNLYAGIATQRTCEKEIIRRFTEMENDIFESIKEYLDFPGNFQSVYHQWVAQDLFSKMKALPIRTKIL